MSKPNETSDEIPDTTLSGDLVSEMDEWYLGWAKTLNRKEDEK